MQAKETVRRHGALQKGAELAPVELGQAIASGAVQRALLKHHGVEHLVAVVGPSYGGFLAFQWAVSFPDWVNGIVPVTTDIKANAGSAASLSALIAKLETDPHWHGGDYYDDGGLAGTMTRIRINTMVRYGIHELLVPDFPDLAAREADIERMARKWAAESDADAMISLGRTSSRFDVQDALTRIKARVLFVLCRTDKVFPPSLAPGAMAKFQEAGVRAEYFGLDSDLGHTASGLAGDQWAPKLAEFIAQLGGRS